MEMCDPTSEQVQKTEQEQTLNPQAEAPEAEAKATDANDVKPADNPMAVAEEEMTEAIETQQAEEAEAEAPTEALTKEALLERARALLEKDAADIQRDQLTRLRLHFATLRKIEVDNARTAFAEAGNQPEAFEPAEDPVENEFNEVVNQIRDKKNTWAAQQEEKRQANLKEKNEIIDRINALAADTDNVNRTFPEYRELQDRFNAIGEVPPTEETNLWKRFQEAREHYGDNLKINKELRDYDFKKNLDAKNLLIAEAVGLDNEADVITAFRRLQDLHDKWRQIGPVAKELREEIWQKFKDASAAINKKYQAFFEERKAREAEAEAAKTALCQQIEELDFSSLTSFAAWDAMTERIIALQAQWKGLGFAPRKVNNTLFSRFRQRCDEFFTSKAAYFKQVKEEYAANLAKKQALAQRAEELKDSTEWRKATDEFVAMQKEWKTIGAGPKKHSDSVWKRFQSACDHFFEQKKAANNGQRSIEQANLKAKRQVIADLEALAKEAATAPDAGERLRKLQDRWQEVGHVPFRDKDQVNDAYRAAVNSLRRILKNNDNQASYERFETNISSIEGDQGKLLRERDRLARALEARRNEIRTYENNLGFLTLKSKSGNKIVEELQEKIERLRQDIVSIQEKITLIDSKLQ
ncbi:MAG: DUF349 domain-containing protein [Bacteroidales bacterium]|nr:DUF349 domain-containing protein [Bacteroidales bacterium]